MMDKVRAALSAGGPTYMHVLDPCPKGWHYDPEHSNELGKLAIETGIYPLYEIKEGVCTLTGVTKQIAEGKRKRKPVREYLEKQGRFAQFKNQDYAYFQKKVDEMWEQWVIPTVVAFSYGGPINITGDIPKVRNRNVVRENASWAGIPGHAHEEFKEVVADPYEPWRDDNELGEYPWALPSTGQ
jgi:pyruvate ferredoxin oxidoreductase beta subunit